MFLDLQNRNGLLLLLTLLKFELITMQNQNQTTNQDQNNQSQIAIIEYFLKPIAPSSGNQMIQAIKDDVNFQLICQGIGWALSQSEQGLVTVNKDYIEMKVNQRLVSLADPETISQRLRNKSGQLELATEKLQNLSLKLDCLIQELESKQKLLTSKSLQLVKNKQEAIEDSQILQHQNTKLQKQLHAEYKQNISDKMNKRSIDNFQDDEQIQLEEILKKYHCTSTGFPKNKNEAVRLLNNLEVQIQNLEVHKLSIS